jgi:hypothetical protein
VNHVRMRLIALAALSVVTALALAASSASALPEFGQCFVQPKHEGKYTNNVCTKKALKVEEKFTGEFEWRKASEIEAAKRKVEGTGGETVLTANYTICEPGSDVRAQKCREGETERVDAAHVTCESEVSHGDLSGTKNLSNVTITLHGCKLHFFGEASSCSNTSTEGEIQVSALKGQLGFINKKATPREAGLLLNAAKKGGKLFSAPCEDGFAVALGQGNEAEGCVYPLTHCGGDGFISAIGPVNTMGTELNVVASVNEAEAENVPSKFEGKALEVLESYLFAPGTPGTSMWSKAGWASSEVFKAPEAVEIKAN